LVKSLKSDWLIFKRLRGILENEDESTKEVVEGRMRRFLPFLERKATTSKKYAPLGDVPIIVPSLQLLCPDCVGDDL